MIACSEGLLHINPGLLQRAPVSVRRGVLEEYRLRLDMRVLEQVGPEVDRHGAHDIDDDSNNPSTAAVPVCHSTSDPTVYAEST